MAINKRGRGAYVGGRNKKSEKKGGVSMSKSFVCCYCQKEVEGFGNDPYDFSEDFYEKHRKDELCCDKCYAERVTKRKMKNVGITKR